MVMNTLFSRPALKLLNISAVALAASLLLTAAPPSLAQTTTAPPAAPSAQRMPLSPQQMAAHAQKRLDKLERSLNLQPGQQAAWASYKSSALADMNDGAAKMQQRREQMQRDQASGATTTVSAPQRMEERAKRMREHADALSRKAQQTQSLYSVLTPEQRTIFDLQMQGHRHAQRWMSRRQG
jgi:DNA anti-recombination protein RmuC